MKNRIFIIVLLAAFTLPFASQAKDFHFLATEDNFYVNPANWYPSYPGSHINAGDKITIEAEAYYEGFRIEVEGTMEVALGAEVISAGGEILVRPTGTLNNYGVIRIDGIRNFGKMTNEISSNTQLKFFSSHNQSVTTNMANANFMATGDVVNVGTFNNYGYCSVGNDLYNLKRSVFNQIRRAELIVRGTLQSSADATLNRSADSLVQVSKEKMHATGETASLTANRNW